MAQFATSWNCCIGWTSFNQFSPGTSTKGIGQDLSGILTRGDDKTPYTQTYNITVSQRAPWHSVFEVQYQGNRSRDMMLRGGLSDINLIPMGTFFKADPTDGIVHCIPGRDPVCDSSFDANRYYPRKNYHQIQLITHGSYSNYNSMIMSWQKQTGRATFTTNYTFGKALGIRDNQTDNGTGQGNTNDPFSMKNNYGVLAFDHSHIFNAAYVISLPNLTKGNKIAGGVTNGWVLSGITQVQSGAAIQPNANGDMNASWPGSYSVQNYLGTNAPNLKVMPRLTCDPRKGLSSGQYFNPSCFAPPVAGANGDIVWPYIKGPKFFNSDLAIYKDFKFKESQKISFRFSMFNFLNHALPALNPNGSDNNAIKLNFNTAAGTLAQTNQNALTTGKANYTQGRRLLEFSVRYSF